MNLLQLLPSADSLKPLQAIEHALLRRRTAGNLAGFVALAAAAVQIASTLAQTDGGKKLVALAGDLLTFRFDEIARQLQGDTSAIAGWIVFFLGALIYLLLRWTGVLAQEAKEAFRYTFWVEGFGFDKLVTPGARFSLTGDDRLALLHQDLIERLDRRIRRFSLIKEPTKDAAAGSDSTPLPPRLAGSHIYIAGTVALRERDDGWVIQIMPTVRIGAAGAPATLAQSVVYPLAARQEPGYGLKADDYHQIVERLYSSVATEIYRRIESDVVQKIALFPTARLRATALFYEAEDFARSNTVDAYDRAIKLYRSSLAELLSTRIGLITRLLLASRLVLWRLEVKFQHELARIVGGLAKCLVYRHLGSALAGRESRPLYELPDLLGPAIASLETLHARFGRRSADTRVGRMSTFYGLPHYRLLKRLVASQEAQFPAQKRILFELYVADALVNHFLDRHKEARARLQDAAATEPDLAGSSPLYLMAQALLEPAIDRRLLYCRQAVELSPEFQAPLWVLANAEDDGFRQRDEITSARADIVKNEYQRLRVLNYGNVQAASSQGFVLWLVDNPEARKYLEEGRHVKAIASETFVGELSYRLARIAAEQGDFERCRQLYEEAIAADPELGVGASKSASARARDADTRFIGRSMLGRFHRYRRQVERGLAGADERAFVQIETLGINERIAYAFALNDFGNACLSFFHQHGDQQVLDDAIAAYERAARVNPADAVPWFNLQNAYSWTDKYDRIESCYKRARSLAPAWTLVAIEAASGHARSAAEQLTRSEVSVEQAVEAVEAAQSDLADANERHDRLSSNAQIAVAPAPASSAPAAGPQAQGESLLSLRAGAATVAPTSPGVDELAHASRAVTESEEKLRSARSARAEAQRELSRSIAAFRAARSGALEEIRLAARFGALLDGDPLRQARRLATLPWDKLQGRDVEMLIRWCKLLAMRADRTELVAVETVARRLLAMLPENYELIEVLVDVVDRLLVIDKGEPRATGAYVDHVNRTWLAAQVRSLDAQLKLYWLQAFPRSFVAHYWYDSLEPGGYGIDLARLQETYFGADPEAFEELSGWVRFHRAKPDYKEAIAAFERARTHRPQRAAHYLHCIALCRGRQQDWEGMLAASAEAARLEPDTRSYQHTMAGALNRLGIGHYSKREYPDAVDKYTQAVRYNGDDPDYESNLANAREHFHEPSIESALEEAIKAKERAVSGSPEPAKLLADLRRLRNRLAAIRLYGGKQPIDSLQKVTEFGVLCGRKLDHLVHDATTKSLTPDLERHYGRLRSELESFGLRLPAPVWWAPSDRYGEGELWVLLRGVGQWTHSTHPDLSYGIVPAEALKAAGVTPAATLEDPLTGEEACWFDAATVPDLGEKLPSLQRLDALEFVMRCLKAVLQARLHDFVGPEEVVERLKASSSTATSQLADMPEHIVELTVLLRALLAERVPIANLDAICSAYLEAAPMRFDRMLACIRSLPELRHKLWGLQHEYERVPTTEKFDALIASGIADASAPVAGWALEPERCQEALSAIGAAVGSLRRAAIVVLNAQTRIYVRRLVELQYPTVPVLALDEIGTNGLHASIRVELED